MPRISIQYKKYSNSKMATFLSFLGGTLFTLCVLPGVILVGLSAVKLVFSVFGSSEAWAELGTAVLVLVIGGIAGVILNLVFNKIATMAAMRKRGKN